MAIRVAWSSEALEDVEEIAAYIERDSPWYARAVVQAIFKVSGTLSRFPSRGRVVPEIGNEAIRERFIYSYRLIYRVAPKDVLVVAVIHGKRLVEPLIERIEGEF